MSRADVGGDTLRPSVIIVTYRSAATLAACVDALRPQVRDARGDVLVVDNASPDDTVAVAVELGLDVLETGANLGFAAGCNIGADKVSGDLLVFVNPDTIVAPGALRALLDVACERPRAGPLGGRAHHADGSYDRRSVLGHPSLRGAILFAVGASTYLRGSPRFDPEHGPPHLPADGRRQVVPAVSGALLASPRALWAGLGGFDERFFLYGEDVDLSVRAVAAGWQPTVVTDAGYQHLGGASSVATGDAGVLLYRGKVELYRRHLRPTAARVAVAALQLGTLVRGVPTIVPVHSVARRARPWWELFRLRRRWRTGYESHIRRMRRP